MLKRFDEADLQFTPVTLAAEASDVAGRVDRKLPEWLDLLLSAAFLPILFFEFLLLGIRDKSRRPCYYLEFRDDGW